MIIELKPRSERTLSVDQVIEELRPQVAQVPGMRVFMTNPPPINIGARGGRALYQFTLQDTDTDELYHWAPILEEKMKELPELQDVNSDLLVNNPQVSIDLDRDRISALGLTVNQVETAMFNAYGTRQISQIYAPNNQYQVILGVAPEFQKDPSALSQLYVRSSSGRLISLDTVTTASTQARTADHQPHRPASVGHDLVQPQAGRRARRCGDARFSSSPATRCRRRSRRASRAPRRRSRIRCRDSASSS